MSFTQEQYDVHFQRTRTTRVKLEWLNWQEHKIGELQGNLIDGNISIDRNSAIKRTCNLTFVIDNDMFLPSPNSYVWLNKKFRLLIGIDSIITGETVYFNKGIYILNEPTLTYSKEDRIIRVEGLD